MASSFSKNARLQKPAPSDRNWDAPINANVDALDAMTAIGGLVVTTVETPSASLAIRVAAGSYVKADGTIGSFAGVASILVPASSSLVVWLTDAGAVITGVAYPATAHLRLARVMTGATAVAQLSDDRVQCAVNGSGLGFVSKTGDTMTGPLVVASPSGTALVNVDPTGRTVGFFGATPATQAAGLTLLTAAAGTASDTVADVTATHSQTILNNNFASLTAKVDALILTLKRHGLMGS